MWFRQTRCAALAIVSGAAAFAGSHPRLLVSADDLPRLRHACGIGEPQLRAGAGPFASRSTEFMALRSHLARWPETIGHGEAGASGDRPVVALPGDIAAAALLHLIAPDDPGDASRLAILNAALRSPPLLDDDGIELALALDWCWPSLDRAARSDYLDAIRERNRILGPQDSPLDHRGFREKLITLAVVAAVDSEDHPGGAWSAFRARVLDAAQRYFETTFAAFVAWRGRSPTSSAAAAWEENDAALAVELWRTIGRRDAWEVQRDGVARWCEHRVVAAVREGHGFVELPHDDVGLAVEPSGRPDGLAIPSTAHLLAARTGDPAAAAVADALEQSMRRSPGALPPSYCVSAILFDVRGIPRADRSALPTARNLDGAIVLRGRPPEGDDRETMTVWIDTGQPLLGRGQHFDAGHFLIHRGGFLAVSGGADVASEATAEKGGMQRLGGRDAAFDFDQYYMGTIAHNCVVFNDPARAGYWRGKRYVPIAGQTPREDIVRDFSTPPDQQNRSMGRLLAYGAADGLAYAALDLTAAYDPRSVSVVSREFVFVLGQALLVIDRARPAHARVRPTALVQLPARPRVDDAELSRQRQTHGASSEAGVWECDADAWIRSAERDGALWVRCLWPGESRVRIVGGPARRLPLAGGRDSSGYVGGDAGGFERLIHPVGHGEALNAWFRLGPRFRGELRGMPHWGRVEIESAVEQAEYVFVTLLAASAADANRPPRASAALRDGELDVSLACGEGRAVVRIPLGLRRGGFVQRVHPPADEWPLPTQVVADAPLATRSD